MKKLNEGNSMMRTTMTGGRAVAEMVNLYEPGPIFGMGGFQMLPFYEGARDLGLQHVLINDERTGAFAANAYANLTGKPGLCDGTLGPGATNLVTGLVESFNAGVPVIAFVGEQDRNHAWKNMTQETRQQEILSPVCKEYIRVEKISRIPELVRRAFSVATSGRPGPVILAVPEDVAHEEAEFDASDFWADERAVRVPMWRSRGESEAVAQAVGMLTSAKRPIILNGGGVHPSGAHAQLLDLARALNAPVAHTLTGKGGIPCSDTLSVGVFGRYSRYANELIDEADAILAVGCKLGEIATKRYSIPRQDIPLIHLDLEPDVIGQWSKVAVGLLGDARETLKDLVEGVCAQGETPAREELWQEIELRRQEWAAESDPKYTSEESPVHMARLIGELNTALPEDATLIADGGFASHWTGLLYNSKQAGKWYLTDRGFASIGYGVPGAIGAKIARPNSPVVAITGDGGFNMSVGDLETARRENLEFVVIIVNNAASGYVKALQHAMYGPGHYSSSDLSDMDYSKVAEAYGCRGIRVDDPADLAGALQSALAEKGRPVVIDVAVTRDPSKMLPAVDSRTLKVEAGDRPA